MCRTQVIIGKISPGSVNRTLTPSISVLLRHEGAYLDNDRRRSIQYPTYYTATCQNEKNTLHIVSF